MQIYQYGENTEDRTGTGTKFIFGIDPLRINLADAFPILATKRIHLKSVIHELLWFISGDTNIKYLQDNGVSIWDEWADPNGNLGPVYGSQWRNFGGVDQIKRAIQMLKDKPTSRQNVVSAWNPVDVPNMALPPCHMSFQLRAHDGKLNCHLYQRSADWFLGVPFNMASYALLTMMIARVSGLESGTLIMSFGDAHLYNNHREQAFTQMNRYQPLSESGNFLQRFQKPFMGIIRDIEDIDSFRYEDFRLSAYRPMTSIKAPIAV